MCLGGIILPIAWGMGLEKAWVFFQAGVGGGVEIKLGGR